MVNGVTKNLANTLEKSLTKSVANRIQSSILASIVVIWTSNFEDSLCPNAEADFLNRISNLVSKIFQRLSQY